MQYIYVFKKYASSLRIRMKQSRLYEMEYTYRYIYIYTKQLSHFLTFAKPRKNKYF